MAVGSIYTVHDNGGSDLISNIAGENQLTLSTEDDSSADITAQGGNQAWRIQNSGRYLIITSVGINYVDIGNNNRHVMRTTVRVGGTNVRGITGQASSFGRDSGAADEGQAVTISYIDHTVVGSSADDITVHIENVGDQASEISDMIASRTSLQIIRLDDSADWIQVERNAAQAVTGTMGYTGADPTWNDISLDNQVVETDTAVLEWVSGSDITAKETGKYLILAHGWTQSTGNRYGAGFRVLVDGSEAIGSRWASYNRTTDGAVDHYGASATVVDIDVSGGNKVIKGQWSSVSELDPGTNLDIEEYALTVIRLPDSVEGFSVYHSTARAHETTGALPMDAEAFDDATFHDTVTNNSRITMDGDRDMLVFFGWWVACDAVDSTRVTSHEAWALNGTRDETVGSGMSYDRGDQSTRGIPGSGRQAARAYSGLVNTNYIEINHDLESGVGDQNRIWPANTYGMSGIDLTTLVAASNPAAVSVSDAAQTTAAATGSVTATLSSAVDHSAVAFAIQPPQASQTLDLGTPPVAPAPDGVNLTASGSATITLDTPTVPPAPSGVDLAGSGSVTLSLQNPSVPAAPAGVNLTASGAAALLLGNAAVAGAPAGVDLVGSGSVALTLDTPTAPPSPGGVNLTGIGSATLSLGSPTVPSAPDGVDLVSGGVTLDLGGPPVAASPGGVNITPAGSIDLLLGNPSAPPSPGGIDLTGTGSTALALGTPSAPGAPSGADLVASGSAPFLLGNTTAPASPGGIDLAGSGSTTLDVGSPSSPASPGGVEVTSAGTIVLLLGNPPVAGSPGGVDFGGSGTATLSLGNPPPAPSPGGVNLLQSGLPPPKWSHSAQMTGALRRGDR